MSLNSTILVGRTTKEVEHRKTQTGTSVVSFTLAVNRRFKKEGQPDVDFIRCVAWSKTAELMVQHVNKGAQIGVEGRIQTGSYQDKDGKTIYTTDVVVENVTFLEPKNQVSEPYQAQQGSVHEPQSTGYDTVDISSDDLPF